MSLLLYFLSSLLYAFSFPNFIEPNFHNNFGWVAFFCLVPFIIATDRQKNPGGVIRGSFFCGLSLWLLGMYWLTEVTRLGYIILASYMALYMVVFGLIRFYNKSFFVVPLSWTALEFIRGNFGGGIPWLLLGASQYKFISLIQVANITGVYGISFLVSMVNAGFSSFSRRKWIFILCVFALTILYGKHVGEKPIAGKSIRIGLIQPNIPLDIKWDSQYTNWMIDKLTGLSEKATPCGLMVWPETAVPTLPESEITQKKLRQMTDELDCKLITGSQGIDTKGNYYNSAFLISNDGKPDAEYRKIHLVPFGEYVPFGNFMPLFRKLTPIQGEFKKGTEYTVFNLDGMTLSVLICFEDIFPGLARRFVSNGAEILVNITNDVWFGKSAGPYQHAVLSIFRAVENRTPLVRATNTGVSCFISPNGEIVEIVKDKLGRELFIDGLAVRDIVANRDNTFYTRYGDIFGLACVFSLIITIRKRFSFRTGGKNVR